MCDTTTLPSSTATIIRVNRYRKSVTFGHIGDSFGIAYYTDGSSELFTDNRNESYDRKVLSLVRKIATQDGKTNRDARNDFRVALALIDMAKERNNSAAGNGSGCINGDSNAYRYIQSGHLALDRLHSVLLGTDGLVPQDMSIKRGPDRNLLLTIISDAGFANLMEIKRRSEDDDPDWRHLRYKHSDDATGILVRFSNRT